jgi:capsular polysaccharide transport system permease protein
LSKFKPASAFTNACKVWKALMLRESLSRLFATRTSWLWLLAEPVFHLAYLMLIFSLLRVSSVGGSRTPLWILTGLLTYFFFSHTSQQMATAINANQALFAYRQIKPMDTLWVRGVLEFVLLGVIALLMYAGVWLFVDLSWPSDAFGILLAWTTAWVLGLGWGLVLSCVNELLPDLGHVLKLLTMPMMLLSGVMLPVALVPPSMLDIVLLNPLVHVIESARMGIHAHYHLVNGIHMSYAMWWALSMLMVGLTLQRRFSYKLVAL